jgi:guanylate kinase
MAHIITVTGPSGAGKSTTLRRLVTASAHGFKPVIVQKYTTRPKHADDADEVICVEEADFPKECDLVYEQYGHRYGLVLAELYAYLAEGRSPLVILNDVRTVEDVRNHWKGLVKSVFIFRESPSLEKYQELAEVREVNVEEENPHVRYQKAQILYRTYIENIHLFDHVIINSGTFDDLKLQVDQIVTGLKTYANWPLRH